MIALFVKSDNELKIQAGSEFEFISPDTGWVGVNQQAYSKSLTDRQMLQCIVLQKAQLQKPMIRKLKKQP